MSQPHVVTVILNTNRREDTLACLASLHRGDYPKHTIIVLDNASTDGSVEAVRQSFPAVEILSLAENRGYAGNNNVGIEAALARGADWVFVLNEDTLLATDCLTQLVAIGESDARIGIVGDASAGGSDVFLTKLDPSGQLLFSEQWGTAADDTAAALAQAPTGEIFAAISVDDAAQGCVPGQALLLKWDEDGTNPVPQLFDTCEEDRATALTVDPNGTVYLAGLTYGSFSGGTSRGGSDIFLVKSQILY